MCINKYNYSHYKIVLGLLISWNDKNYIFIVALFSTHFSLKAVCWAKNVKFII